MRWRSAAAGLGWVALGGCRVVDAPARLEDLMVFGFREFDDEAARQAVAERLLEEVPEHREGLTEGLRATELARPDLRAAGVPTNEPVDILGAVGLVRYEHATAGVARVITHLHKDQVFDETLTYTVVDHGDRACFLAGDCETYAYEAVEETAVPLLGTSTQRLRQELAWVETDAGAVLLGRTLAPEPVVFTTELVAIDQQFGFLALWDDRGGSQRVEAFWVDARFLGLDVPDRFAVDQAVGSMGRYAEQVDQFLDE